MNEKEVLLPISSHHCRTTHSACDCVQRLKKLEAVFAVAESIAWGSEANLEEQLPKLITAVADMEKKP